MHVWYAAYGSNMDLARLNRYLAGGRPAGAARAYPGCRDPRPPARSVPLSLPGRLYFATHSPVWDGGRAFHDPTAAGRTLVRAHLLTAGQFADVAAQEMYREPSRTPDPDLDWDPDPDLDLDLDPDRDPDPDPDPDLDLTEVLASGRAVLGPGRYETLVCPGSFDGTPVLTFTAPWRMTDVAPVPPSAPYLRLLAAGLRAAGGHGLWDDATIAAYLAEAPGVAPRWSPADVAALVSTPAGTSDDPGA